jgi:hypothetical protein
VSLDRFRGFFGDGNGFARFVAEALPESYRL